MTKEEAKKAAEVMLAYANGKEIEHWNDQWVTNKEPKFNWNYTNYRIKPTYRPFKDAGECWNEMLKHQPFGWIKVKGKSYYSCMTEVLDTNNFQFEFDNYTFADGTPFGVK